MSETIFSADEWHRYTRHIQLSDFGVTGQKKLKQSKVTMIGAGGLGCPAALYLAAAGVGSITLVDGDQIELTNLQRQVAFDTVQVGKNKAQVLQQRLVALNPEIQVTAISHDLTQNNAHPLIQSSDLVLDCTDNFATRYLINDVCYQRKVPWIMASIGEFYGQVAFFTSNNHAFGSESNSQDKATHTCFRCQFPQAPDKIQDCNSGGVLGVLPGLLAMYQTTEAIKYLAGLEISLNDQLLIVDAMTMTHRKFRLQKNADCLLCSQPADDIQLSDFSQNYSRQCEQESSRVGSDLGSGLDSGSSLVSGSDSGSELELELEPDKPTNISPKQFDENRKNADVIVLDVRSHAEREAFHIGGEHIPVDELEPRINQLDSEKHYLVYCQSGRRGNNACALLKLQSFKRVNNLKGGLVAWLSQ